MCGASFAHVSHTTCIFEANVMIKGCAARETFTVHGTRTNKSIKKYFLHKTVLNEIEKIDFFSNEKTKMKKENLVAKQRTSHKSISTTSMRAFYGWTFLSFHFYLVARKRAHRTQRKWMEWAHFIRMLSRTQNVLLHALLSDELRYHWFAFVLLGFSFSFIV